jgi:hypothetical protein
MEVQIEDALTPTLRAKYAWVGSYVASNAAKLPRGRGCQTCATDGKFCVAGLGGQRLHQMQKSEWLVLSASQQPRFRRASTARVFMVPTLLVTKKLGGRAAFSIRELGAPGKSAPPVG